MDLTAFDQARRSKSNDLQVVTRGQEFLRRVNLHLQVLNAEITETEVCTTIRGLASGKALAFQANSIRSYWIRTQVLWPSIKILFWFLESYARVFLNQRKTHFAQGRTDQYPLLTKI